MRSLFTPAVHRSLYLARREAERLSPVPLTLVGSEHWLLDLRGLRNSTAQQVLRSRGCRVEDGTSMFESRAAQAEVITPEVNAVYTPSFKRTLAIALECAPPPLHPICSSRDVGTHHVLAALLRTELTTAIDLATMGVTPSAVEAENEKLGHSFCDEI